MKLRGKPGAQVHRCMYRLTTADLHMQFDITISIQFSVYKQQCSYVHE